MVCGRRDPDAAAGSFHRVGTVAEDAIVVALAADLAREWAEDIVVRLETLNQRAEVVARLPAEFGARLIIDIDPVNAASHSPAAAGIFLLIVGDVTTHHLRRLAAQFREVVTRKRRRRADDVFCKAR